MNMKRVIRMISLLVCFCLLGVLTSCMNPIHFNRLPENHLGSTYHCEEYDIKFTVHNESFLVVKGEGISDYCSSITGEMTVNGVEYEFYADSNADYTMGFYSKEIEKEEVYDRYDLEIFDKYCLIGMNCDYKMDGVIIATVGSGSIFEKGTKLTFVKNN